MEKVTLVEKIIDLQGADQKKIPVDVVLKNGNILIRSFQILNFNSAEDELEGVTRLEVYSSLRERREPVFCRFKLSEIKQLLCPDLDVQVA